MKKISVKKETLVILMIIATIFAISTTVLATGNPSGPVQIPTINTTTEPATPNQSTNTEMNTTTNTTNDIAPTTNTTMQTNTVSNYQNTTLPQTGDASDYAIFMLIAVTAIIAVYAYKKVRDYDIK